MNQQFTSVPTPAVGTQAPPGFEVKKKPRFPLTRIIAISIGTVIGIPMMLIGFVQFQSAVLTRASDITPRDVIISETTPTSATVHWTTGEASQGTILYGTEPTAMRLLAPENARVTDHEVVIELLAPSTTYYFTIRIGDEIYNNGGEPWVFTTKSTNPQEIAPTVVLPTSSTCPQKDDCNEIQKMMGKGCTVTDYVQCVKRKE